MVLDFSYSGKSSSHSYLLVCLKGPGSVITTLVVCICVHTYGQLVVYLPIFMQNLANCLLTVASYLEYRYVIGGITCYYRLRFPLHHQKSPPSVQYLHTENNDESCHAGSGCSMCGSSLREYFCPPCCLMPAPLSSPSSLQICIQMNI